MSTDLETVLGDGEQPADETSKGDAPETNVETGNPDVDATAENPGDDDPAPAEDTPQGWQYAAYKDEKTKRQELEAKYEEANRQAAELKAWRDQVLQQQQQYQAQQQQVNPQAAFQQLSGQLEHTQKNARLDASEINARGMHGDEKVDAAYKALGDVTAQDGGAAYNQIMSSKHPWSELVKWHEKHQVMSQIGDDPNAFLEAEKAKWIAEMQANGSVPLDPTPNTQPNPAAMPSDFSQTRNVGSRTGSNWSGPTPLGAVLKD